MWVLYSPSINITIRDTGLADGAAKTGRVRDDGGAVVISRRDGSARGRDASLPSSLVGVLGPAEAGRALVSFFYERGGWRL